MEQMDAELREHFLLVSLDDDSDECSSSDANDSLAGEEATPQEEAAAATPAPDASSATDDSAARARKSEVIARVKEEFGSQEYHEFCSIDVVRFIFKEFGRCADEVFIEAVRSTLKVYECNGQNCLGRFESRRAFWEHIESRKEHRVKSRDFNTELRTNLVLLVFPELRKEDLNSRSQLLGKVAQVRQMFRGGLLTPAQESTYLRALAKICLMRAYRPVNRLRGQQRAQQQEGAEPATTGAAALMGDAI